jgi:hypothetical protein
MEFRDLYATILPSKLNKGFFMKKTTMALLSLCLLPAVLWADMSAKELTGIWYEKAYGEQTVWLNADGQCKFVRGKVTLFSPKTCSWNAEGEMHLNYHGVQSKIFMLLEENTLMMAKNPALISKYTAETLLTKTDDPLQASREGQKPLLGKWEALDHSMQLQLLSDDQCQYLKGDDALFSRSQCTWSAGEEGATLIFTDPKNSEHNTALFVKRIGNRLFADKEKSNLIPTRAKIQMVQVGKE